MSMGISRIATEASAMSTILLGLFATYAQGK